MANRSPATVLTRGQRAEIVDRRAAGETTLTLAAEFSVSKSYVNKLVAKSGHTVPNTRPPLLSQEQLLDCISKMESGITSAALAKEYNVSKATVLQNAARLKEAQLLQSEPEPFEEYDLTWVRAAACALEDPEYFEYEPGRDEEVEDALARYELAKEICLGCPVLTECHDAASQADRTWTTRGGLMPLALRRRLKGD